MHKQLPLWSLPSDQSFRSMAYQFALCLIITATLLCRPTLCGCEPLAVGQEAEVAMSSSFHISCERNVI